MNKQTPFSVCGESLSAPMHICGFFDSREKQYEVIIPYILEGLEANDKVVNILEGNRHSEHCRCLADNGISIAQKLSSGQLEVLASENSYIKDGEFAAEKMYKMLEQTLLSASRAGYDSVRACGDMVWALKNLPGTDELLEYEARLNLLTPQHAVSLICMYDISSFSQNTLRDILLTHPYVIKDGKISKNPHYVEPLELISSLSHSRSGALKS
ncbi:MEDS domain-containing protein [Flavobacterium chilense]|uniref:MEDS: MEthanogen/methylotroph, DcmR Sensory domain n=1 Tax=Flavobacterium chilense TaxID=946677 RepID=A0A1M6ZW98_9FLAO|nr:MEDS domain-containing protein [Flavobacterium chilense]SHL34666.1 MEDS: MEthanogen/methylotroph, DcmR Sensory domain [Flavobacterium chilense]